MNTRLVVLTGAGMSAESGLKTFRDQDGLWEGHEVEKVATPRGWKQNPQLVLDFYNQRRAQLAEAEPNNGHLLLAELEKRFKVTIITQNIDDLHERAGSGSVIHLHGELTKVRSLDDSREVLDWGYKPLTLNDRSPAGSGLRPHIVWFGEEVPELPRAAQIMASADMALIIGTSLAVYPAAGLTAYLPPDKPLYLIDPNPPKVGRDVKVITAGASQGVKEFCQSIKSSGAAEA